MSNKKCSQCNKTLKDDEEIFTESISTFNGFCHSSDRLDFCSSCFSKSYIIRPMADFLKTKHGLFYREIPCGCFERVRSEKHLHEIYFADFHYLRECLNRQ